MKQFDFLHFKSNTDVHSANLNATNSNQTRFGDNIILWPIDNYKCHAAKYEKRYNEYDVISDERIEEFICCFGQIVRMNPDSGHHILIQLKHFKFRHCNWILIQIFNHFQELSETNWTIQEIHGIL